MKTVRPVLFACAVCLAGGVLAGVSNARADDCTVIPDAAIAGAKVPHAVTHVTTAPGKPPISVEMIFTADKAYTQIDGAWHAIAYSAQQQVDTIKAAKIRTEQTAHTCRKLDSQPIGGEAASLYVVQSDMNGAVSEARVWISDKTGFLLKSEDHLKNGTVVTDEFRYGNIAAPSGVN